MLETTLSFVTTYQYPVAPYSEIRTTKKSDSIWFAVQDVCNAIELPDSIKEFEDVGSQEQAILTVWIDGENLEINMISGSGLRELVENSKKAKARKFLKWVEREIMPQGMNGDGNFSYGDLEENNQPANMSSFQFHNSVDHEIRTIQKEDGSIWFVAKDVCGVLEIKNSRDAISMLDDDEKASVGITDTSKSSRKTISVQTVSESGLYMLVFRSRKPEAKKFRKWVTSEVLPQIRQTGSYIHGTTVKDDNVSAKAITAFLQATTDTFWGIEKALTEYKAAENNLKKARKDASLIIRSIGQAFPSSRESVELLGALDGPLLAVEMR